MGIFVSCNVTTDQEVGSSSLPGRANSFRHLGGFRAGLSNSCRVGQPDFWALFARRAFLGGMVPFPSLLMPDRIAGLILGRAGAGTITRRGELSW